MATEYAATNPGWWGDSGLNLWDLLNWSIYQEFYILSETISPDLLPTFQEWGIQANYFRLRLAMEQCDSDYPCEAWHQYFSGITAVFFTGVPYSDKRCVKSLRG